MDPFLAELALAAAAGRCFDDGERGLSTSSGAAHSGGGGGERDEARPRRSRQNAGGSSGFKGTADNAKTKICLRYVSRRFLWTRDKEQTRPRKRRATRG